AFVVQGPPTTVICAVPYTTLFRSPDESGFLLRMGSGHDPEGTGEDAEIVHLRLSDGAMLPVTDDRVNSRMVALSRDGQLVTRSRSEEHTSELQSRENLVCRLLLEK